MRINADAQPTTTTRPDGDVITTGYDLAGRLQTFTVPRGSFSYGYDAPTGKLASVSGPGGSSRTFAYQGSLLASLTSSGPATGSLSWAYDNNLRITSRTVNGGNGAAFGYDADDLLTSLGSLSIARSVQNGLPTGTSVGNISDAITYSTFGEVSAYTASSGAGQLYQQSYTRDNLGRITQRIETVQGATSTWDYRYNISGRLERVERNGTLFESYGYDSNDNIITVTRPSGVTNATFDSQDRILTSGSTSFTHDSNGDLLTRTDATGTTTFDFDASGQLLSVSKPNGDVVSYDLDAGNKRAIKRVNGVAQSRWLYGGGLSPVAELDATGNLVSVFYGGYMVKNGTTYRILRDHLGSVRLVVDAGTGEVVQRLSYGPHGEIVEDTNPGFQPFGFAGGQYDSDTGLIRYGVREYDPQMGRWLTKDPSGLGDSLNLYAYVKNDPINFIDPTGLDRAAALGWWAAVGQDPDNGNLLVMVYSTQKGTEPIIEADSLTVSIKGKRKGKIVSNCLTMEGAPVGQVNFFNGRTRVDIITVERSQFADERGARKFDQLDIVIVPVGPKTEDGIPLLPVPTREYVQQTYNLDSHGFITPRQQPNHPAVPAYQYPVSGRGEFAPK